MNTRSDIVQRFFGYVDFSDNCWEWAGAKYSNNYGSFFIEKVDGRGIFKMAHRVAYELCNGIIPDGLVVDHLCDNPSCVNPSHLEAKTQRDNVQRGKSKIITCPRGHDYTEVNTYIRPRGGRECRACRAYHVKQSLNKKKEYTK